MMDVPDMDRLMGMMQTKEAADAMEHDGVKPAGTGTTGTALVWLRAHCFL
jgi:hypothetical protein